MKKKFKFISIIFVVFMLSACVKNLTVDELNKLIDSKEIDNIKWSDFASYRREADYSAGQNWIYQLEDGSTLILSGFKEEEAPREISIIELNGEAIYLKKE